MSKNMRNSITILVNLYIVKYVVINRRLGAKGSYLTLVRVADRIL